MYRFHGAQMSLTLVFISCLCSYGKLNNCYYLDPSILGEVAASFLAEAYPLVPGIHPVEVVHLGVVVRRHEVAHPPDEAGHPDEVGHPDAAVRLDAMVRLGVTVPLAVA